MRSSAIALGGWAPLAPDDARYLYVGLSILDGHGPVTPSGSTFLLRSPVYGLALATGSSLVGGDPLVGARLVALGLSLLALAGALRLGWLLAGPGGALGTAFALVAAALIWRLIPSLRIDLPQTAAIVATLLAVWRPTTRRWALGGVLLGLAILVKETALPLLILPVALVGSVPPARLARLAAVFVGAAVLTAAWWWVVVWVSTGQVFPLNALSVIEARDVDVALRVDRSTAFLLAWRSPAGGWSPGAPSADTGRTASCSSRRSAWRRPRCTPRASGSTRATSLASPSCPRSRSVPAGRGWLRSSGSGERPDRPRQRRLATIALVGVAVVALAAPVVGQRDAGRVAPDRIGDELAAWLAANVPEGGRVAMAFREREQMALRLYGRRGRGHPADRAGRRLGGSGGLPVDGPARPSAVRLSAGGLERTISGELGGAGQPADLLVLVGPHPFTPIGVDRDARDRRSAGPHPGHDPGGRRGPARRSIAWTRERRSGAAERPLHLSAEAAEAWLDLAGGDAAAGRLLDARPVVDGDPEAIAALTDRLGETACATPTPDGLDRARTCGNLPGLTRTARHGTSVATLHRTDGRGRSPVRALPIRRAACHRQRMNFISRRIPIRPAPRGPRPAGRDGRHAARRGHCRRRRGRPDPDGPPERFPVRHLREQERDLQRRLHPVMKSAAGPNNAVNYLNAAQRCGLKVIMSFPETVNHSLGRVYPSRVPYWVNLVKNHPNLYRLSDGQGAVLEPPVGDRDPLDLLRLPQGRSDPPGHRHLRRHPAFQHGRQPVGHGDGRHPRSSTGTRSRPPTAAARGRAPTTSAPARSTSPGSARSWPRKTPGTPVWLMAQTHKNLNPRCHKKQGPTEALLRRQVREALRLPGRHGHRVPHLVEHELPA